MGQSTDGQISYGVRFPEGFEFPWDRSHDGDEDAWWREVFGYKPPFELYDKDSEYLDGKKPAQERINEYYDAQTTWENANPLPFKLVNYCSGECPVYILSVPGTVVTANRGYPQELDPQKALTVRQMAVDKLMTFIAEHIKVDPEEWDDEDCDVTLPAKWWLSSEWD